MKNAFSFKSSFRNHGLEWILHQQCFQSRYIFWHLIIKCCACCIMLLFRCTFVFRVHVNVVQLSTFFIVETETLIWTLVSIFFVFSYSKHSFFPLNCEVCTWGGVSKDPARWRETHQSAATQQALARRKDSYTGSDRETLRGSWISQLLPTGSE